MTPRKTHDYPGGKPLPLVFAEIAFGVVGLLWIVAPISWWLVALFGVALVALVFVRSELLDRYEHTGRAIRRPSRKQIVFLGRMPAPMRALRYAVVLPMIAMFAFGLAPMAIAKIGIIGCILCLFVLSAVYIGLQLFYESTGRGQEIINMPDSSFNKKPPSTL